MTREALRKAAIEHIKSCSNLIIQAGTGTGKSLVALNTLSSIKNVNKVLILVAERAHIKNWQDEITKWNISFKDINIACYASMKHYTKTSWDAIIFDEAHHLNSELRLNYFEDLRANYRIFLSATLRESLVFSLKSIVGDIETISLNLQEAINSKILPKPKIFLIPIELDNKIVNQTIIEEWGKKTLRKKAECTYADRWKYLRAKKTVPNASLIIHCTARQKYDYICEQFEFYKKRYFCCRSEALKNKWLQCGSKRKTYLGLMKTEVAKSLLNTLQDQRYICFCTNIEQANYLGGNNAVHSKKKDCFTTIDSFNSGKISNLFAVGMLQEGVNLTDIQAGVIIQLDGEERSFIQRFGRVLRSTSPEQYIIYIKNTRDEEYLNNALEGIDKQYIKTLTIDELNNK